MADKILPLFSTLDEDPDHREEIDAFVVSLAERVDLLQDVEAASEHDELERLSAELGEAATHLGFAPIAAVTAKVIRACGEDKPDAAQEALVELTGLAQRVRLGHRGSF